MKQIRFDKIGNIKEDYRYENNCERSMSMGLLVHPNLVLNMYKLIKVNSEGDYYKGPLNVAVNNFLDCEIILERIDPLIGLGFTILSEGMLNVARWDNEKSHVLRNQIYSFEENIKIAKILDIGEVGAFCTEELEIVSYEKEAWKKYLISQHTEKDKRRYLQDFY